MRLLVTSLVLAALGACSSSSTQTPTDTRATACTDGETRCLNGELQVCNARRDGFVFAGTCGGGGDGGGGGGSDAGPSACTPGAARCQDATTRAICTPSGATEAAETCPTALPKCTGNGECVRCVGASDCPKPSGPCTVAACLQNSCTTTNAPEGTAVARADLVGTCKKSICASGVPTVVADSANAPTSATVCATPACDGGQPSWTVANAGVACEGGKACDGTGFCGTSPDCTTAQLSYFQNNIGSHYIATACSQAGQCHSAAVRSAALDLSVIDPNTCRQLKSYWTGLAALSDPNAADAHPFKWTNANCNQLVPAEPNCFANYKSKIDTWRITP